MDGENATLVTRKEVIDEIADDMDFGPAVGPPGPLMFSGSQIKPPQLRIGHDLFPQRSTPARDDLDHCLHPGRFTRNSSLLQCLFGTKGSKPGLQEAIGT